MNRLFISIAIPLTACHWGFKPHPDEGRYLTGMPGDPWVEVNPGSADHAWFNQEQSAAIYTDSNCGRRYEDGSLDSLIDHVTRGIAQGEPSREINLQLADRDALVRAWSGVMDGGGG